MGLEKFGPGVIGQKAFDAITRANGRGPRRKFGPGVLDPEPEPELVKAKAAAPKPEPPVPDFPPADPDEAAPPEPSFVSVAVLEQALSENPGAVDDYLEGEVNRPAGPRKGAIRALLAAEEKRKGGPRPAVVEILNARLTPVEV